MGCGWLRVGCSKALHVRRGAIGWQKAHQALESTTPSHVLAEALDRKRVRQIGWVVEKNWACFGAAEISYRHQPRTAGGALEDFLRRSFLGELVSQLWWLVVVGQVSESQVLSQLPACSIVANTRNFAYWE